MTRRAVTTLLTLALATLGLVAAAPAAQVQPRFTG